MEKETERFLGLLFYAESIGDENLRALSIKEILNKILEHKNNLSDYIKVRLFEYYILNKIIVIFCIDPNLADVGKINEESWFKMLNSVLDINSDELLKSVSINSMIDYFAMQMMSENILSRVNEDNNTIQDLWELIIPIKKLKDEVLQICSNEIFLRRYPFLSSLPSIIGKIEESENKKILKKTSRILFA